MLNMRVHERSKKNPSLIVKTRPYVRLSQKDQPVLFFQDGLYTEDGKGIDKTPEWAKEQLDNLNKKVKSEIKYRG